MFALVDAHVTPQRAFFDARPVHIGFHFRSDAPQDLQIEIVRRSTGAVVRAYSRPAAVPLVAQRVDWAGLTRAGRVAPNGRYAVRLRRPGQAGRRLGVFALHSHRYPIRGPHADRGGIGVFGAPRSGGRTHEGYDVTAACGTPLVAARGGRVKASRYDPVLYGNLVIIRGRKTHRDYWYAHLRAPALVQRGDRVRTGQRLGDVGDTGNARSVGCHLHFELHQNGVPIDPAPLLHAWDGWS